MSEKRSSESKLIKNNYKKRLYGDGFETQKSHYTLDENIDLIRGIISLELASGKKFSRILFWNFLNVELLWVWNNVPSIWPQTANY